MSGTPISDADMDAASAEAEQLSYKIEDVLEVHAGIELQTSINTPTVLSAKASLTVEFALAYLTMLWLRTKADPDDAMEHLHDMTQLFLMAAHEMPNRVWP